MAISQDWSDQQISDYRLLRRLGAGSFGDVYLAEDLREQNQVAVKLIKASLTGRDDLKAFLNEARSMRLRHPHILPLLDFGLSEQDLPFLVIEYVAGGTLRDRYPKGYQVPLQEVVSLTTQLASALQYAHDRHLMHRDVKPENMLCRTDGTVLLSDFGLASVAHASSSASANQTFGGTLPYMAPEQLQGKPRPASDQYALAVVVYEWLTGVRPFQGTVLELMSQHMQAPPPSLRDQLTSLPTTVEQVVFQALSKEPKARYPRVSDFALALQAAYQQHVAPPVITLSSSGHPALPQSHQPVLDQPTELSQAKEDFSPPAVPSVPPPSPQADQPSSRETEAPIAPLSSMATLVEVPPSPRPATPAPVSRLVPHRRVSNRRVLFSLLLALLIALSGGSLYYFGSIARPRTLSLTEATVTAIAANQATATAATQAYTVGVTKNGVMFGFDAAHTHNNPYEHTLSPANVPRLKSQWSFVTGGPIESSPAAANGMVYVGSDDHKLYAFDASCRNTCKPLWSFSTGSAIYSSPAIAGGMVYVGSDKLYAFDASCRNSCQPLWSFSTGNRLLSSPTVAGGMVYIGSDDGKLYVFDASCRNSCQPLWTFSIGNWILSSPAVAGGIVYVGSDDHKLYAFDASCRNSCQPLWNFATGNSIFSSPAVAGGMVYVGSWDHKLYVFDASCRNFCQPLWTFSTGAAISLSSPAVASGMVYVGSDDHKLYAFDASCRNSCQPLWTFSTGNSIYSPPTVAGGMVYIGSDDHKLYAFDASCRKACLPLWSSPTGNKIGSSPAIANGMVYVGSSDHNLYAFGLGT